MTYSSYDILKKKKHSRKDIKHDFELKETMPISDRLSKEREYIDTILLDISKYEKTKIKKRRFRYEIKN